MPGMQGGWSRWGGMAAVMMIVLAVGGGQAQSGRQPAPAIEPPEQALGLGADETRRLPGWAQLLRYYRRLDQQSEWLEIREMGRTSLGRPQVALFVSAPQNLRDLETLGANRRRAARAEPAAREMARERVFLLVTAGMDPTEVSGTLAATKLLHRLLTERTSKVTRILEEVVVILVPSLNPDGAEMMADWFVKSMETPAEGGLPAPPRVAHKYAGMVSGQESGGDFDAFTQLETQLLVDKVLNPWRPQIWYDLRQTRAEVDAQLYRTSSPISRRLLRDGPVTLSEELPGSPANWARQHDTLFIEAWTAGRGLPESRPMARSIANPIDKLIPSGMIERQVAGLFSLLEQLAGESAQGLLTRSGTAGAGHRGLGGAPARRSAAKPGRFPVPSAYLLPEPLVPDSISRAYQKLTKDLRQVTGSEEEQHAQTEALFSEAVGEPSTSREIRYFYQTEGLDRLLAILKRGGVEVRRADQEFVTDGRTWPVGTHIVSVDQPNGAFAREILDPRAARRAGSGALPLLFNVEVARVDAPLTVQSRPEPMALVIQERVRENGGVRVGVYRGRAPSADEGWIRWLFDQYRFGYESLSEAELRQSGIAARFDAIILPDQTMVELERALAGGQDRRTTAPPDMAESGGDAALRSLRNFVESGGTLITFNQASFFIARQFRLPVRSVSAEPLDRRAKGRMSILRLEVDPADPLSLGIGGESIACYENGPVFEVLDPQVARVVARYPARGAKSLLLYGSLPGQISLAGRAALVEVKVGRGRVILFGFRPLYRGRSLATFPFIFNSLMTSGRTDRQ